jgi:hypothetical protein
MDKIPGTLGNIKFPAGKQYVQYTESTRVSVPSSELGPPPSPPPQASVSLHLDPKGEGSNHSYAGEGVGGPNSDD